MKNRLIREGSHWRAVVEGGPEGVTRSKPLTREEAEVELGRREAAPAAPKPKGKPADPGKPAEMKAEKVIAEIKAEPTVEAPAEPVKDAPKGPVVNVKPAPTVSLR